MWYNLPKNKTDGKRMKRICKLSTFSAMTMLLFVFLCSFSASEEQITPVQYKIVQDSEEYLLIPKDGGTSISSFSSLNDALSSLPLASEVLFEDVRCDEEVRISSSLTFSGSLSFDGTASLTVEAEGVHFSSFDLKFNTGCVRIRTGTLNMSSGSIFSSGVALLQDYSESSLFVMNGGSIESTGKETAFILSRGTARILEGNIRTLGEYSIENGGDLTLGRSVLLESSRYSFYTSRAVSLFGEGRPEFKIKYGKVIEYGSMNEIFLSCIDSDLAWISAFDSDENEMHLRYFENSDFSEEECFIGVHSSIKITFKDCEDTVFEYGAVKDFIIKSPTPRQKRGFYFDGWYLDPELCERFNFDYAFSSDTVLYAKYSLSKPEFSISPLNFVYDGTPHFLTLDAISHPLSDEGIFIIEWYFNGEYISTGESVALRSVSDSGQYSCKIKFLYGRHTSYAEAPSVEVRIDKESVSPPNIPPLYYNKEAQVPKIQNSLLYTYECESGVDTGIYKVYFTLVDPQNYKWETGEDACLMTSFEIKQAKNEFVGEISVFDTYFLAENTFFAKSKFGSVRFEYYLKGENTPLSKRPDTPGDYLAVAVVDGTENYSSLRSQPVAFSILTERAVGISLVSQPTKTEYLAFEKFDLSGLSVRIDYDSGRKEFLNSNALNITYQTAESFRFGDTAVLVSSHGLTLSLSVSVQRISYDTSGFSFLDAVCVYDGEEHFPTLLGQMPVGLDGVGLEYSFSSGATHVLDGEVFVTVTFFSKSENYTVPEPQICKVEITPKPISLTWEGAEFVYDGTPKCPNAVSLEAPISVFAEAVNAGEYIALAVGENADFYITNPEFVFVIKKAQNFFTEIPFVGDIFEGYEMSCDGAAYFGEIEFLFYKDEALSERIDPRTPGVYYAVAYVPESKNFLSLTSEAMHFSIVAVVPTALRAELFGNYRAFDTLSPSDFKAWLVYNDKSEELLCGGDVVVTYQNGETLLANDKSVRLSYGGFYTCLPIEVSKAEHCLDFVKWAGLLHVYDGEEKHATLVGLPDTLRLLKIEGGVGTNAGEYAVRAYFDYDFENYEPPSVTDAVMVIERAKVPLPKIPSVTYNGKEYFPKSEDERFEYSMETLAKNAGEYFVTATLIDSENYVFENGDRIAVCSFSVLPREILVKVDDVTVYLWESYKHPRVEFVGDFLDGDEPKYEYYTDGERVGVRVSLANYVFTVEEGKIISSNLPSPEARSYLFIVLLLLILLVLLIVVSVLMRHRISFHIAAIRSRHNLSSGATSVIPIDANGGNNTDTTDDADISSEHLEAFSTPLDMKRADSLISNSLARELVDSDGGAVETVGKRRGVINVDTLAYNFGAGERIDINVLKAKNLIPYDTAYIKVLARGVIDKPLFVYANDFSLAAVKMLALTGGRAIKVTTVKIKSPRQ